MAGTPEEDLLGWLEREEEHLGFTSVEDGLSDVQKARDLFYDELGYDITDAQFQGLKDASFLRYDELPSISTSYEKIYQPAWGGFQDVYRDTITGRFVAKADVYSLLGTIRGT